MLARLHSRGLQSPLSTVIGQHQQIGRFLRTVRTEIADHNVKALSPLRAILYGEFQFHNQLILVQRYK